MAGKNSVASQIPACVGFNLHCNVQDSIHSCWLPISIPHPPDSKADLFQGGSSPLGNVPSDRHAEGTGCRSRQDRPPCIWVEPLYSGMSGELVAAPRRGPGDGSKDPQYSDDTAGNLHKAIHQTHSKMGENQVFTPPFIGTEIVEVGKSRGALSQDRASN